MMILAKSGCPVFGQSEVNSGQLNVTRYSFSGCLFTNVSSTSGEYVSGYLVLLLPRRVTPESSLSFLIANQVIFKCFHLLKQLQYPFGIARVCRPSVAEPLPCGCNASADKFEPGVNNGFSERERVFASVCV